MGRVKWSACRNPFNNKYAWQTCWGYEIESRRLYCKFEAVNLSKKNWTYKLWVCKYDRKSWKRWRKCEIILGSLNDSTNTSGWEALIRKYSAAKVKKGTRWSRWKFRIFKRERNWRWVTRWRCDKNGNTEKGRAN